ncbi:uncharacterized protein DS421_17g581110 [Arachis hypogaea]|nr:uncharacterized protein DS421_17g581110 [Arachis hypogaea]
MNGQIKENESNEGNGRDTIKSFSFMLSTYAYFNKIKILSHFNPFSFNSFLFSHISIYN